MTTILGQDDALNLIHAALTSGRMHHAWIFHGPPGVGKFTTACAVAQTLLCHHDLETSTRPVLPCGQCAACRYFADGRLDHPDLHILRKEQAAESTITQLRNRKQTNIPIDLVRERMIGGWVGSANNKKYYDPQIAIKPLLNHGKVFIIDEAELLAHGRQETQNAMLKFIEEPPPQTHFFLVTSHEERLLPTIRSRCQRVAFRALDDAVVDQLIDALKNPIVSALDTAIAELQSKSRLNKQDKQILSEQLEHRAALDPLPPPRRRAILRFADGSAGRAVLAMDYRLYRWVEAIEPMVAMLAQGQTPERMGPTLADLVEQFATDWQTRHPGASKEAANKAAVRAMLGLLGGACRRRLAEQASAGDDLLAVERQLQPWLGGIDLLNRAEQQLAANVAPALLLNNLAVQWSVRLHSP